MLQRERKQSVLLDQKLSDDERRQASIAIARLCRLSGISSVVYRHIHGQMVGRGSGKRRPLRILNIPTGNVEIPLAWAKRLRKLGQEFELTLVGVTKDDRQQAMIDAAVCNGYCITSLECDCLQTPLPTGFDLVVSLYGMHPLDDHQAFRLLQSLQGSADGTIIVCDFNRSSINLLLSKIASRVASRSPQVRQSIENQIQSAYTIDEFQRLAERALARPVHVESALPCHFIMENMEAVVHDPIPAFA